MTGNHPSSRPPRRFGAAGRRPLRLRVSAPPAVLVLLLVLALVVEGPSVLRRLRFTPPLPWDERGAQRATNLSGLPRIVDGDTIVLDGHHIRLDGIDAPEIDQICQDHNGAPWACGEEASRALKRHLGWGVVPVRCEGTGTDRYNRVLATCFLCDENLNRWMVQQGWAVAYRHYGTEYADDEEQARAAQAGVWSGTFMMPWDWRRAHASSRRER